MDSVDTLSRRAVLASIGSLAVFRLADHVPTDSQAGLVRGSDFLLAPGLAYLNTGSLGPTPKPVMDHTIAAWKELEANPARYGYSLSLPLMENVRAKAARLLGCKLDEIILTRSTTDGMNGVALGLDLHDGDHVLTTDQEHEGGLSCWQHLARTRGIVIDKVKIDVGEQDPQAILDLFAKAVTPKTRAFSFSHVLYSTGMLMPAKALSELAKAKGCFSVIDGAQAAGSMSVNVKDIGCDVYVTTGHKWLLGPKGTGFLYLSEKLGSEVNLIAVEAGRTAFSDSSGVGNIPGILGLGAALDYLESVGFEKIYEHNMNLRRRLADSISGLPKVQIVSPSYGPLATPLLTYSLDRSVDALQLQQALVEKHHVMVRRFKKEALNWHRASTHLFNSEAELAKLTAALAAELK